VQDHLKLDERHYHAGQIVDHPNSVAAVLQRPLRDGNAAEAEGRIMATPLKPLIALSISLFVVSTSLFFYMTGPANIISRPPKGSSIGYPMLDGCFAGYSQQDVDRRLEVWTAEQIATYRAVHLGPDLLFPWLYTGFFFVTALLVFQLACPARALWPLLLILPFLNLIADYIENYLISFVILPAGVPSDAATVAWSSRATCAKWVLVALNTFVLMIGIGLCLRARRK
jgi:hypothetical protein